MLVKHGATVPTNPKAKAPASKVKAAAIVVPKAKINERLIPKEYVLQIMDNGHYRPITDEEFDLLK